MWIWKLFPALSHLWANFFASWWESAGKLSNGLDINFPASAVKIWLIVRQCNDWQIVEPMFEEVQGLRGWILLPSASSLIFSHLLLIHLLDLLSVSKEVHLRLLLKAYSIFWGKILAVGFSMNCIGRPLFSAFCYICLLWSLWTADILFMIQCGIFPLQWWIAEYQMLIQSLITKRNNSELESWRIQKWTAEYLKSPRQIGFDFLDACNSIQLWTQYWLMMRHGGNSNHANMGGGGYSVYFQSTY